jgi:diguanylate cyclase (GGDEF)-like protein
MSLDIRPFWLIGALFAGGFGLLVLVVRKAYPADLARVLMLWGLAHLCLGLNYSLRLGAAREGQFAFNVLSNTLIAVCLSLEYRAIRELKHQPSSPGWIIGPPLIMFTVCAWLTLVQRNISIENMAFDCINAFMMLVIARVLLQPEDGRRLFPDVIAAMLFFALAVAICAVIANFIVDHQFSAEYDFNSPRAIFNNIASILAGGVAFPIFLLMVSERLNRNLVLQAMRDPLTSLFNRRAFEEIAFREMSGAVRTGMSLSLLIFDIDHFKQVNDLYGHTAGDAVLNAVVTNLRRSLRDEDFLCRWGGDEFLALLPRTKREQAQNVAERVLDTFKEFAFPVDGKSIQVGVSIGIVTNEGAAKDISSLIKLADSALYRSKTAGRRRFAFAEERNSQQSRPRQETSDYPTQV